MKIMKKLLTVLMAVLMMTGSLLPVRADTDDLIDVTFEAKYLQEEARSMLEMINEFRAGEDAWAWNSSDTEKIYYNNLQPLTYDYALEKIAMQRAMELVVYYSHTRPDGTNCSTAAVSPFNSQWYGYSENIAVNYESAEKVFTGWREDSYKYAQQGHRRNMLSGSCKTVAFACAEWNGRKFWVTALSSVSADSTPVDIPETIEKRTIPTLRSLLYVFMSPEDLSYNTDNNFGISTGTTVDLPVINSYLKTCMWSEHTIDGPVQVTSSDPSIAKIQGNKITGVKAGTCEVTYKASYCGLEGTKVLTVTVSDTAPKSLKMNFTGLNLATESIWHLRARANPTTAPAAVTWSSSNPSVVSVDQNGVITARQYGTATITAASKANPAVTARCLVTARYYDVFEDTLYYYNPVYWAAQKNITKGYNNVYFGPENNCTREAVVTFLWRAAGKPEPKSTVSKFPDVQDKSKYYYKAVLWAAEKGITGGYSDGTFRPDDTCLREHVVTFLWRYAGKPNPSGSRNPFNDVKSSDYYYKAALWANEKGIAKGYSEGEYAGGFGPKLDCLREHVVTFLYRLLK